MKKFFALLLCFSFSSLSLGQKRGSVQTSSAGRLSYDVSASAGTYASGNYNEINLGLNWDFSESMTWRNSLFSRFGNGVESTNGLDSSLRFKFGSSSQDGTFGVDAFFGPGVRIGSAKSNAAFGEAGVKFTLGGLRLGVGYKGLYYLEVRKDSAGNELPRNDGQFFLTLAGGGVL
ncbi:MAG: hypothetical protein N2578_07325 [Bdellovibrionaceae bacterium]|nr:hypothetical protein [Pseudobdellovibrionaceae bacterium]